MRVQRVTFRPLFSKLGKLKFCKAGVSEEAIEAMALDYTNKSTRVRDTVISEATQLTLCL